MRLIGLSVCGPNEADRYLEKWLKSITAICDDVLIAANNIDDKTEQLLRKYKVKYYYDDREWGVAQPKIKEDLINKAAQLNPDWVLFLDTDEIPEPRLNRHRFDFLMNQDNDICYSFWMLELWDRIDQYRYDFLFDTPRMFKYIPNKTRMMDIPVHCGNVPEDIAKWTTHTEFAMLHYGLLRKEERIRKRDKRYKKYDPDGKYVPDWWYNALGDEKVDVRPINDFYKEKLESYFRKKPINLK